MLTRRFELLPETYLKKILERRGKANTVGSEPSIACVSGNRIYNRRVGLELA